jgi:CRP/FNR family cyclic AMP-dependent transcriptional regulator
MSASAVSDAVADHPFLQGLREPHRKRLAPEIKHFKAAPGEYLSREGEPARGFYLIQSGSVAIGTHLAERGATPIQTVGPGEVVGWSWLVPPYHWQFDACVVNALQGLAIDAGWLREQCENDHELGYDLVKQLLTVISGRLAACRVQRLDIYR